MCAANNAYGQVASTTSEVPPISFVGEQFCFPARFSNSGNIGYAPYYRLILPPDITFVSATLFDVGVPITTVGTFALPDNQLTDPFSGDTLTGVEDGTYYNITLPLSSVVTNGPKLESTICLDISSAAVLGVNLPVSLQPVYRNGDTATGENGAAVGAEVIRNVQPSLFEYTTKVYVQEPEIVPGDGFPMSHEYVVDVADGATIENIDFAEVLDGNLQYVVGGGVVGGIGCSVTPPSTAVPGGVFAGSCSSIVGTDGATDTTFSLQAYAIDILDETTCDTLTVDNSSRFDAELLGAPLTQQTGVSSIEVKHVTNQQSLSSDTGKPGDTITVTNRISVSEFATPNSLVVTDTLDDGWTFTGHLNMTVNGVARAITPTVTANPDGTYTIVYDIYAVTGSIAPGDRFILTYTVSIDQDYNVAPDPVLAEDPLDTLTIWSKGPVVAVTILTPG